MKVFIVILCFFSILSLMIADNTYNIIKIKYLDGIEKISNNTGKTWKVIPNTSRITTMKWLDYPSKISYNYGETWEYLSDIKNNNNDGRREVKIFPSVINNSYLNMSFKSNPRTALEIEIFDITGSLVLKNKNIINSGNSKITIEIGSLINGKYIVILKNNNNYYNLHNSQTTK